MSASHPHAPPDFRAAAAEDESVIVALWQASNLVVSHNDPVADFRFARSGAASDVLVALSDGRIVGTVMVGHDGHRGWAYYVAVDAAHRGRGIGRALIGQAETWLRDRGVRKLQLLVRRSNAGMLSFYRRIGFEPSDVVMMQHWIEPP